MRHKKLNQSGIIAPYMFLIGVLIPIFVGYLVLGANIVRMQHMADFTSNVLHGALNVAAREVDPSQLALGNKVVVMANAKSRFNDVITSFHNAETVRNTKMMDKIVVSANDMREVTTGTIAPNGIRVYTNSLYIEGKFTFEIQLPGLGDFTLPLSTEVTVSAIEGVHGTDLFSNPIF